MNRESQDKSFSQPEKECSHPIVWINPQVETKRQLKQFLTSEFQHCPNCGGLIPELGFHFADKQFVFTCYEIATPETWTIGEHGTENHKPRRVIVETDYIKLRNYLEATKQ